jgi:hypothetical protein
MKKRALVLVTILLIISFASVVEAKPNRLIEKRVFIHRVKPDNPGKPDKPPKGDESGGGKEWYKYSGIHWASSDLAVSYVVDLDGSGLESGPAMSIIVSSFEVWGIETGTEIFGSATQGDIVTGGLDDINGISFGEEEEGIIAVTSIWYYTLSREIVEVDTLFNTHYSWSLSGESGMMDLGNIATHEFGHWLLLEDLYNKPAGDQTMFGYSTYGEISKQTLESGDIAGIEAIYGP